MPFGRFGFRGVFCLVAVLAACSAIGVTPAWGAEGANQTPAAGATPPVVMELQLQDGSILYGVIEGETPERVVLRTIAGVVIDVERARIASLEPAQGVVIDGRFVPADPNATRLLFSPTGRSLRKGQGYVGVYEFILPFVQVGVTDSFSIGVGTPLVFFGDETNRPVWVTPKVQFYESARVSAAAGVMHFHVFGEDARAGLAYTVATIGTDDNAWTAGAGWAYSRYYNNEYDASCFVMAQVRPCEPVRTAQVEGSPVVMLGGERRLSRRVKVITENYGFAEGGLVSVGVRFIGDRLSADLGAVAPVGVGEVIVLPVVNFVWTFGR